MIEYEEIKAAAEAGNVKAKVVMNLAYLHHSCPSDPGARAMLSVALGEWRRERRATEQAGAGERKP